MEEMERGRCWCGMHDPRKEEEKKRAREEAEEMLVSKLEGGTPVWVKMWVSWRFLFAARC